MKLRLVVLGALSLVAFAVPTTPVDAKGPTTLLVSGDGIDGMVVVRPTDRPARFWTLVEATGFFEFGAGAAVSALRRSDDIASVADLGIRLRLTWIVPGGGEDGATSRLRQDLYPFARGGPRLDTPEDQTVYGYSVAAGSRRVDSNVVTLLRRLGVPVTRHAVIDDVVSVSPPWLGTVWALVRW
jgi:hypothetical protein